MHFSDAIQQLLDLRVFLISFLICLCVYEFYDWWNVKMSSLMNLPPGPWGLPGVGCIPYLFLASYRTGLPLSEPHLLLTHLTESYGKVYSMYVGSKLLVFLNSYSSIRDAFQNRFISDRPYSNIVEKLGGKGEGINLSSGSPWIEQRRFTLRAFSRFGLGKRRFEDQVLMEAGVLVSECFKYGGKAFNPDILFPKATSNVLCSVIFGKRFDYDEPKFERLLHISKRQIEIIGTGVVALYVPLVKYFQGDITQELVAITTEQREELNKFITEHKENFDPDNLDSYLDVYLSEIEKSKENGTESEVNEDNLICTIREIFGAGTESSASTMGWLMLHMMEYPEVQTRVHQELDAVVGRNRMPRMSDKPDLVYTHATILEVQRIQSIGPLGFPHLSSQKTSIGDFEIPAGTIVVPNVWAIDHDPDVWPDPWRFDPNRFISEDGGIFREEEVIPFSLGRRVCLGENLAKMELFLFFSHLLHQFTIKKVDKMTKLDFKGVVGSTYSPRPFEMIADKRE
ncbi:cytochrome P450 2U1-like [Amphiura filiformis]|uniref:cytochrome P450 2U1-like n=1 Tax=Amphiura filiformis TaxID=82378 RepID=UPI003B21F1E4